jgi:hypothetical protein
LVELTSPQTDVVFCIFPINICRVNVTVDHS